MAFANDNLYFGPRSSRGLMWGPIIEKAWAKAAGNYINSDGGQLVNALRFLTGAPVFNYIAELDYPEADDNDIRRNFLMLMDAYEAGYLMNAGTFDGDDYGGDLTDCGVSTGHAFSILAAFTMNIPDGGAH